MVCSSIQICSRKSAFSCYQSRLGFFVLCTLCFRYSELLYPKDKFICKSEVQYVVGDFMVARKFTVFLEPAEEGGFIVKCLELPVASQGETREEALKNIKEAIEGYLEVKTKLLGRKAKGEKTEVIVEAPSALMA
jgi:predicted RNase H-like HicB family nuclease